MIPIYYPAASGVAAYLLSRLGLRFPARAELQIRWRTSASGRKTPRVLVTGASGFLGRAVVDALADDGKTVRAAMRFAPDPPLDGVQVVYQPDLAKAIDWRPLVKDVDTVIHLAGIEHGKRPANYDRINHVATARLAGAARRAGVRHFVFVSSIRAQSGPSADHALTERDAAAPSDAYGRSKFAAEEAVRASGVPFTILRLVPVYGPGMRGPLASLFRTAASWWPLPVRDFTNRRSYLGLDNFISALRFVLATPVTTGQTYVVADPGVPPSTADLIATLRRARGRRRFFLPLQFRFAEVPLRALHMGDLWDRYCGNLRVDPAKLIAAGWRPLHDTRAGFVAMVLDSGAPTELTPPVAPQAPDRPQTQPG